MKRIIVITLQYIEAGLQILGEKITETIEHLDPENKIT